MGTVECPKPFSKSTEYQTPAFIEESTSQEVYFISVRVVWRWFIVFD